jgi:hypothetical protein
MTMLTMSAERAFALRAREIARAMLRASQPFPNKVLRLTLPARAG